MRIVNRLSELISLFGIDRNTLVELTNRQRTLIDRDINSKDKQINIKFVENYKNVFEDLSLKMTDNQYVIYLKTEDIQYVINE